MKVIEGFRKLVSEQVEKRRRIPHPGQIATKQRAQDADDAEAPRVTRLR
jgi:hypothetical protein